MNDETVLCPHCRGFDLDCEACAGTGEVYPDERDHALDLGNGLLDEV